MAHEKGNLNDLRAILGNDVAIKAYREGKRCAEEECVRKLAESMIRDYIPERN